MNKRLLLAVCTLAIGTSGALASAVIIKQRAKEVARPGTPPLTRPNPGNNPAAAPAPAAGGAPAVSAAQQQAISKLKADIAVIKSKKEITPELKAQFKKDLAAAAEGATKPSAESVGKLGDDLATALVDKKISTEDVAELAKDLAAVLNSANVTPVEVMNLSNTAKEILASCGITKQDVTTIAGDFKAIIGEMQKSAPKAAGK